MSGLTLAGDVRAAVLDENGNFAGYLDAMNSTEITLTPGEGTSIPRKSRMHDTDGDILDIATTPGDPQISLTTDELGTAEILSLAMLGSTSALTEAGATVTDESLTASALDRWFPLAGRNINEAGFSLTSDPIGTTHVEGTDYEVDRVFGLIKFLSTGGIAVDAPLLANYTKLGVTGNLITGRAKSSLRLRILMNGKNKFTGRKFRLLVRDCELSPGGINLMASEALAASYSGLIRTPSGLAPYDLEDLAYATS